MLDLGAAIERFQGPWRYLGFVALCAVVSNVAQLELGGTPTFGGLSGIVYALVGYVWARGRFDPTAGIRVRPQLVTFLVFWLVLGFTGVLDSLVGRVANYCHLGGLISGAACGYVAARRAVRGLLR
jgi:GlpG protein